MSGVRHDHVLMAASILALLGSPARAAPSTVASQSQTKSFLGGKGGILAFTDRSDSFKVKYIDINDWSLTIRTLSGDTNCGNPIVHPDGNKILYAKDGKVYARNLPDTGTRVEIGTGALGHWYNDGSYDYVIYCDTTGKWEYQNGDTYRQRMNGIQKDGSGSTICSTGAMDGGLTRDGKWLGEAYGGLNVYEIATGTMKDISGGVQHCNASMAPDGSHRILTLRNGHRDVDRHTRSGSSWNRSAFNTSMIDRTYWQTPEWATDANYFTALGTNADNQGPYDLYIGRMSDSTALKVVATTANYFQHHLQVGDTAASAPSLSLSPTSLTFSAVQGGSNPSSKTVSVANSSTGTLDTVSTSESAGWLSVSRSGTGNSQTLTNSIPISGLSAGTYTATVNVHCPNASNSPRTYSVTLTITYGSGPGSGVLREVWTGIGGTSVGDLTSSPDYPQNPSSSETATSFEGPVDWSDNYGTRFRGYVIPPATGTYYFWIASDDASQLLLNGNGTDPSGSTQIAYVSTYTGSRQWTKEANQKSSGISLSSGQTYYIEALHKEGTGGDNICVRWELPGGVIEEPVPGHRLNPFVPQVNDPPNAVNDSKSTNEDTATTIDVLANDSDPDSDSLSVSGTTQPAHGFVTVGADQRITYTPDADWSGADSFTYTASDGRGGADTATVSVTVNEINDAPVAQNDSASTSEDTSVTITVLANDSDVDGDALSVSGASTPPNGTATVNGDDTITYTPDSGWAGADSFTYTASDGKGGTDTATVTVNVTAAGNNPPVASADGATTDAGTAVVIDVLANDTDPDGDGLSVQSTGNPSQGSVVIEADDTVTYTPDAGFSGSDSFTYTVSDGKGGTDTATVTVTVNPTGGPLPSPWETQDIGAVGAAGSASYDGGAFTVAGSGADIWGAADEFRYVYQALSGDGEIVARVASITNTNSWAKAGVMIRDDLTAGAVHAAMVVTPGSGASFQRRKIADDQSESTTQAGVTAPEWVKLVRSGDTFYGYVSDDGSAWTLVGTDTVAMGASVQIGMAVTAHSDGALNVATFDNVSVTVSGAAHIKINCGSNTCDVSGWDRDDGYVSGGEDYVNPDGDTFTEQDVIGGVANAAPLDVYKSVHHRSPHSYDIPVPDGDYVVRIHFIDRYENRKMDYFIEGVQVLDNFDISSEAGGINRALVKDFSVPVTDGNGIQILCDQGDGNDVFEAGIEIIPGTANDPPSASCSADPAVGYAPLACQFTGTATDADGTIQSYHWDFGDGGTSDQQNPSYTYQAAGNFTARFTVTDDDGATGTDTVAITVYDADAPFINITNPSAGSVWYVGTDQHVTWATNLDDVVINYSTDGGQTWNPVVDSVDATRPEWLDYPWTVPDEPSTQCMIFMAGYLMGEAPTQSGVFEIRSVADGDGDGLDDAWEEAFFGDTSATAGGDDEGDGLTNLQEFTAGTDPTEADTDGDGLPDEWEVTNGTSPTTDDAAADPDQDGYSNYDEYRGGSDPLDGASAPSGGDVTDPFSCSGGGPAARGAAARAIALVAAFAMLLGALRPAGEGRR